MIILLAYAARSGAAIEIQHVAPDVVSVGQRLQLEARIGDAEGAIELVRAYFKTPAQPDYLYTRMPATGAEADAYSAILPAPAEAAERIEYFFLVRTAAGEVVKSQNFDVEVISDLAVLARREDLPPRRVVLEPTEFAAVDGFHGRMLRLSGSVEIVNAVGETRSPAEAGYVVRELETVRTGGGAVVVLDFDQDPLAVLDSNSRLNVRASSWFSHVAGKAYFAFRRLLGVSRRERMVTNTVALIEIRGTTFISYDGAIKGVALKEGTVDVSGSRARPFSLRRDGAVQTTNRFTLQPDRLALFGGDLVTDTASTPGVRADFARLEAFAAGLAGLPQTAGQPRLEVFSEAPPAAANVARFDDYITLRPAPVSEVLGAATGRTVVAGNSGGTSPWLIAGAGIGAAAAVSRSGAGGGGGGNLTPLPSNIVATVNVTCNSCPVAIVDTNAIQDDYYDLYVNNVLIGSVNNPPGGSTRYTVDFPSGASTMELRFSAVQCCGTVLEADFNNGEVITPFSGSTNHTWTVNAP